MNANEEQIVYCQIFFPLHVAFDRDVIKKKGNNKAQGIVWKQFPFLGINIFFSFKLWLDVHIMCVCLPQCTHCSFFSLFIFLIVHSHAVYAHWSRNCPNLLYFAWACCTCCICDGYLALTSTPFTSFATSTYPVPTHMHPMTKTNNCHLFVFEFEFDFIGG